MWLEFLVSIDVTIITCIDTATSLGFEEGDGVRPWIAVPNGTAKGTK
jgi:hypothetical protein